MPFSMLRPDLVARHTITRAVACPRCHARPLERCIIIAQDGEHAGSEMDLHHIQRAAVAHPDIFPSVPNPADAAPHPSHFSEARIALSLLIRSVYCPDCEAIPGEPCEGRTAFTGTMSMYHLLRAVAADPTLIESA